eukprot:Plantae.Rhodophyta-Purpureofilum_apyrenoidigerum.ctg5325.p1 GENE.Plantae.Rhodophyta-Purpureofilum_apyrenoidigerum.ctg5325~~Plantae.Rhodophyta-Purpureofilum_apyrenoidigerum.ctg5325.p1  ORF type:complete len:275 (+),score=33.81 Plantae.Rhodophyta-Purpureofilum_apyrenoidigerum.ctg5325:63-887(+)
METAGLEYLMRNDSWRRATNAVAVTTITATVSASLAQPIDVVSKVAKGTNSNLLQAAYKITSESGIGGLFRGNQFEILRKVPTKAVRVMTHEWSNSLLRRFRERNDSQQVSRIADNMLVSTFAAVFSVAVTYPFHLLHVYHAKGLNFASINRSCIYRGVRPLCISTIPSVAVELFIYNILRDRQDSSQNFLSLLTMSMMARMAGQTCAQPFKLVSKRIAVAESSGMRKTISQIISESGPLGLFQGIEVKYMKTIVSVMAAKAAALQLGPELISA